MEVLPCQSELSVSGPGFERSHLSNTSLQCHHQPAKSSSFIQSSESNKLKSINYRRVIIYYYYYYYYYYYFVCLFVCLLACLLLRINVFLLLYLLLISL
jgi:hypothetical protein